MTWSDCGKFLVTGGADGMIHVFSLMDLVDPTIPSSTSTNNGGNSSVAPFHTWSIHHLAVTCLVALPSGRVASASNDGKVVVLELLPIERLE